MQRVQIWAGDQVQDPVNKNSSDTSETLSTKGVTVVQSAGVLKIGAKAIFAYIGIEINDVRFGFGTVTASKGQLVELGDMITLEGEREVETFQIISAVVGAHADLQISIQY